MSEKFCTIGVFGSKFGMIGVVVSVILLNGSGLVLFKGTFNILDVLEKNEYFDE